MGILDIFKRPDINAGVEEYRNNPGALLVDVRGADEYRQGHIPGSVNLPLSGLGGRKSIGVGRTARCTSIASAGPAAPRRRPCSGA